MGNDRVGSVIVNAGGLQKRVTVRQASGDVILATDLERLVFPIEGGMKKVTSRAIPLLRWRSEPKPLGSSSPK